MVKFVYESMLSVHGLEVSILLTIFLKESSQGVPVLP